MIKGKFWFGKAFGYGYDRGVKVLIVIITKKN
jgi:hypothetical protein